VRASSPAISPRFLGYFICSLASLFYVYDFIIRIIPGTIADTLMVHYQIGAAGLGLLSSFFFLGYMLMQVPCGLLYDRFGPRRLLSCTTFIAAVATYFFIATPYFWLASVARLGMGLGSAFAYIGALVLASRWLPARHYALVAGLIQLLGSLGAIMGEEPLARLTAYFGAYAVIKIVAIVGIVLALIFWLLIQDYPPGTAAQWQQPSGESHEWRRLQHVLANKQNWAVAFYGFTIWAPIAIFASLWAVPFLTTLYNISTVEAAGLASFLWLGVGLGGPILGWYSNHIGLRRLPLLIAAGIGLISSLCILYLPQIPISFMALLLFFYGTASSAQAVTFGLVQDNNVAQHTGTASGFNNMAIVLGGVLFQPLVGLFLKWHWQGKIIDATHVYTITDFRFALLVIPICFILSLLVANLFINETYCQPMRA